MAGESLKTAAQLLAAFPDNQAGLIESVDDRDFIISSSLAVGFIEPIDVPLVLPMTDGVPVDLLSSFTQPGFNGNFWALDGNNHFVPDYANQGINVPAGVTRLLDSSWVMVLSKAGGGTATYTFQLTANAVPVGASTDRVITTTPTAYVFGSVGLYDVAGGAALSAIVTPVGNSDDLTITDMRSAVTTVMI